MRKHEKNEVMDAGEEWYCGDDKQACRRQGTETLASDEGFEAPVEENGLLSDDAIVVIAAIGIDGSGGLGWRLGLGEEGEEGEEGIHWCVKR
jgi:hypothetical protein